VEKRIDDGYRVFHWSHHSGPRGTATNEYQDWLRQQGIDWDEWVKPQGRPAYPSVPARFHQTAWCCEKAIEFLSQKRAGPWLFSVNMFDPHHPFDPPPEYLERCNPDEMPLPRYVEGELDAKPRYQMEDHRAGAYGGIGLAYAKLNDRQRREITAAYYAMIELIDDWTGRMLEALDQTGQRENTIVIFTSDHGEMLGDNGLYLKGPHLYDCAVRVPFVISWPRRLRKGVRSEALIELVDLAPTLLDCLGMEIPRRMQGRSFLPILTGQADPGHHRDFVLAEYYNAVHPRRRKAWATMWRDRRHKINVFHGEELGELYDLEADPGEHANLWDEPRAAALKAGLLKKCLDASVFTMDPDPPRETEY
jgi:arylsulfatase A-like enzyme